MKSLHYVTRTVAFTLAAAVVNCAGADDFIVSVVETGRLEGTKTYGHILCNGELEIADDAVVTCNLVRDGRRLHDFNTL